MSLYQSEVLIWNVSIDGSAPAYQGRERLIYSYYSNIVAENLKLIEFTNSNGQMIQATGGSLDISGSYFENILSNPLITMRDATTLKIANSIFVNSMSLLMGTSIQTIELKYLALYSLYTPEFMINSIDVNTFSFNDSTVTFDNPKNQGEFLIKSTGKCNKSIFKNLTIKNSYTSLGVLQISYPGYNATILFTNLNLENNTAFDGSGILKISESSSNITLDNSTFSYNKALFTSSLDAGKGGAIYYSSKILSSSSGLKLKNCTFINNHASYFGGAVYVYGYPPSIDDSNKFINNTAGPYENNLGSQAISIAYTEKHTYNLTKPINISTNNIVLRDIGSGIVSLQRKYLILMDMYGQPTLDDNSSTINIITNGDVKTSTSSFQALMGAVSLDSLIISGEVNTTKYIMLQTSKTEEIPTFHIQGLANQSYFYAEIWFRDCIKGEIITSEKYCSLCQKGTTHFETGSNFKGPCEICDESKICYGGVEVVPNIEYYRINKNSDIFKKCTDSDVCLGGDVSYFKEKSYTGYCAESYEGIMCSQCKEGLQRIRQSLGCFDCNDSILIIIFTVLVFAVNIAFLFMILRSLIKKNSFSISNISKAKGSSFISKLKIFLCHQQTITLIQQIEIRWPKAIKYFIEIQKTLGSANKDVFNLECYFSKPEDRYIKLVISNFIPFFITLILISLVLFYLKFTPISNPHEKKKIIWFAVFIVWFYCQSFILAENFSMTSCINLNRTDNPIYFLNSDKQIKCDSFEHKMWTSYFALPIVIAWLIVPIYYFRKIRLSSVILKDYGASQDFLMKGYFKKDRIWEFVKLARIYSIIFFITYEAYESSELVLYTVIYVILGSYLIKEKNSPYKAKGLNFIENISLGTSLAMIMIGLYVTKFDPSENLQSALSVIFILLNLYFYYHLVKKRKKKEYVNYTTDKDDRDTISNVTDAKSLVFDEMESPNFKIVKIKRPNHPINIFKRKKVY